SLRELLFRQYEQELAKVLGELYGRLNTQLAANGFHSDPRGEAPAQTAGQQAAAVPPSPLDATSRILASQQARAWLEAGIGGMVQEVPARLRQPGPEPAQAPRPKAPATTAEPPNADVFRAAPAARVQHQQLRDMLHGWREGMLAGTSGGRVSGEHAPDRRLGERRELRPQEVRS